MSREEAGSVPAGSASLSATGPGGPAGMSREEAGLVPAGSVGLSATGCWGAPVAGHGVGLTGSGGTGGEEAGLALALACLLGSLCGAWHLPACARGGVWKASCWGALGLARFTAAAALAAWIRRGAL